MIAHEDDIIVAETGIIDIRNKHYLVPHNVSAVFTGRNDVCKQLYENCVSSRPFKTQTRFVLKDPSVAEICTGQSGEVLVRRLITV